MVKVWGRLGIQKKIFAGLASILVLMAAMLAVHVVSGMVQGDLADRVIHRLLPTRAAVRNVRRLVLSADDRGASLLLAQSPAARQRFLRGYRSDVSQVDNWLREPKPAQPPDERLALTNVRKRWAVYLAGNERAFRFSRQGRAAQARSTYVAVTYVPLFRALGIYEQLVQSRIDETEKRRAAVGVGAATASAVLGAGALGLAIVTAVRLGGSLRRRLGVVSGAIADVVRNDLVQLDVSFRNIAAGDFAAPRYVYVRRPIEDGDSDEIGQLARSYNDLLLSLRAMSARIDQAVHEARRRRKAEERLAYLEQYDEVTGLANRHLLHVELDHAIRVPDRPGEHLAVVSFGLLGFKKIEDGFGHTFAQQVLRFIASRLRRAIRESDMAARGGTDEFFVVLDSVSGREEAVGRTQRLITVLSKPFALDGRELLVNLSAGVSVYPHDGEDADELLRNAKTAMSYAKESGSGEVEMYASGLRSRSLQHVTLESDIQRALSESEFELHYQPIIDVRARRIDAFEALLRWRHPRLGLLEPASFLDVAEENMAIESIGSWVLHTACAQAQQWRSDGFEIGISVNVSMRQFRGDLVAIVERALRQSHFPAKSLELELTETLLLTDRQRAGDALAQLKQLGVRLAIDDFGSGYSSLAYLRTFPLDGLKIDRSFVSDITTGSYDKAIANTIILLGHSLGVRVVAEGVENAKQAVILHKLGCDAMQGYFFGRPAPAAQTLELLKGSLS